ncbi:class I SAM-dependent DNA methyltransferase [Planktotalea arctica]|uniref:class I SAM-dependent DNA methyltransferase n=1 Tax=Planktotalea arctica TaxID=1481893 RepID=UPI000A170F54|nr:methyltransferase domain-containing protein [Planktotalea arctica]
MSDTFLDKAYNTAGIAATRDLYSRWAASYEAEVSQNGYATPRRCAEALQAVTLDFDAPILDFGCGTGLSGLALSMAGFSTIDGIDLTQGMLDRAGEKQLYRNLSLSDPDVPFPVRRGDYAAISAIGVIGAGAAPIDVFDMLLGALGTGGKFVLSFNDSTLKIPAFEQRLYASVSCKSAILLSENYGDHLPGINMKSKVYVLEKT